MRVHKDISVVGVYAVVSLQSDLSRRPSELLAINFFLLMSADICCGTGALGLCLAQVCFSAQHRSVSVGLNCKSTENVDIIHYSCNNRIKILHTLFQLIIENRFQL